MNKRTFLGLITAIFMVCVIGGGLFITGLWERLFNSPNNEPRRTKVIIPRELGEAAADSAHAEQMAYEDSLNAKVALEDGEIIVAVLTEDFEGSPVEEQIIAYRSLLEVESPIYLAYIKYDEKTKSYKRFWNAATAASRPGTISLYTSDLIGDRSLCVIVTGMNAQGEHTMTIFRRNIRNNPENPANHSAQFPAAQPFAKIAELRIDGSITVQETGRTLAYQQGIAPGQSFSIAAYGHDNESANILDQLETVYIFNPVTGLYEQNRVTRIPGSQIEQRRLRQILNGESGAFEDFINDLWYFVGPQGTLDSRQYIYFDPASREIIFFGGETQQVFNWQHSTPTRYGLYISSQNISITTLRRFLDIELESLDSIRLRVFEDVRLKIAVGASWDGSYRRAGAQIAKTPERSIKAGIDAAYDGVWGRLRFYPSGEYEISTGAGTQKGHYVFFTVNGQELLELRPLEKRYDSPGGAANGTKNEAAARMVYRIDIPKTESASLSLSRVRLGASGIQDLHERTITLTPAESTTLP
jgi:hypothetical protein